MHFIGVRGASWRARVDDLGTVHPGDGSAPLAWHVAGEERWFSPASEATVRRTWLAGCPVSETRMRVGGGDVVQRVWAVADDGGITLVEFENEGPTAVAVAVTRGDVLTSRPVSPGEPRGIDLPAGSMVLPLAHCSTVRVGLRHAGSGGGLLPDGLPDHRAVVRGWEGACAVASRVVVPDPAVAAAFVSARCALLLGGGAADPVEAVRLGETHRDSIIDVVDHVQRRLRGEKRARTLRWDTPRLLATAARAAMLLDDDTVAGDIGAAWLRLADRPVAPAPEVPPLDGPVVAWVESRFLAPSPSGGSCAVLPDGVPEGWKGASFEAHGLVADPVRTLSYAVRWHGHRPAVLWEVSGAPGLVITAGGDNEQWHTTEQSGETLLATVHDH
ncbi:MAG: hypothetical protein ACKOBO_05575 [Acidimicrobiales bacterium]